LTRALFDNLAAVDFRADLLRNIKSIRESQDLFDDLSDDPKDWAVAIAAELAGKPTAYGSATAIQRPFERARYIAAIGFPFQNWAASRYSDGSYGVWYGADTLATTVHETVHHWWRLLDASAFTSHDRPIAGERRVFQVRCESVLLDFRGKVAEHRRLIDPHDYTYTQEAGRRLHREGHPGVLTRSAHCNGDIAAIFTPAVLSQARDYCYLNYRYEPTRRHIVVERTPGVALMVVQVPTMEITTPLPL
jgi:hypothetical protein